MRYLVFSILCSIFFTACTPLTTTPAAATISPQASIIPTTAFNLGKCVDARQPTPAANEESLFPAVTNQDHILGVTDSKVTILVYSDFQCATCAKLSALLNSFVFKYPQDVRLVFRHFPLITIHDKAQISAQAAEAAGLQGKFWQMHDLLFSSQEEWQALNSDEFQKWILAKAPSIQVDSNRLENDMTNQQIKKIIQKAWDDGQQIRLPGVPVILINGEIIKWQANLMDQMESFIKLAILTEKQFSTCPALVIDPAKQYFAILKTSKGNIRVKLFQDKAPNTVNNFVFLAQNGWFDNNPIFLATPGLSIQTGDPSGTGLGGPGYFIPDEINSSLLYDRAGMVGMANFGPDSNGSQFMITLAPANQFNRKFPVFGEITEGMDVLAALASKTLPSSNPDQKMESIITIVIEAK